MERGKNSQIHLRFEDEIVAFLHIFCPRTDVLIGVKVARAWAKSVTILISECVRLNAFRFRQVLGPVGL